MKKIPSVYQRNYDGDRLVRDEIVPGCEWVLAGEGIGTRKWDGTACMFSGGRLLKRYDAKRGKQPPHDFVPAQEPDEKTGHWPGWVPVGDGPEDRWFREASPKEPLCEGQTYELCGPKINGNPEGYAVHVLIPHGWGDDTRDELAAVPRTFDAIREYLRERKIEGIVWHHPDGRMAKIKRKDFFKNPRTGYTDVVCIGHQRTGWRPELAGR